LFGAAQGRTRRDPDAHDTYDIVSDHTELGEIAQSAEVQG
jgi:hypothetical protein